MSVKLQHDPFGVFKESVTPIGIFVRSHWLREKSRGLMDARREHMEALQASRRENGSWKNRLVPTMEALFSLQLLGGQESGMGEAGVDWLLQKVMGTDKDGEEELPKNLRVQLSPLDTKALRRRHDLVFHRGCGALATISAALYFSAPFNREGDPRVVRAFRHLDKVFRRRRGKWCAFPCSNNVLRAYATHPLKRTSRTTKRALGHLGRLQTRGGEWKGVGYFYHLFNTIAQSAIPSAVRQFERAYGRIVNLQNEDGTWGDAHREFHTFLVLDGLVKQGYLTKRYGLKRFVEFRRKQVGAPPLHRVSQHGEVRLQ